MSLDKEALKTKIKEAFEKAKNTPPPEDPNETENIQNETLTQLAVDLSNAIDAFVKSGDVVNVGVEVEVEVKDINGNPIGTGIGTGIQTDQAGKIE